MSVLKSQQTLSSLQFYATASDLRKNLIPFVMNEKYVPKRWRPVITFPMVEKLHEMMDCIIYANTIRPISLHEGELRRDYQTKAIAVLEQIQQLLIFHLEVLPLNADKLQPYEPIILQEISLLKAWRKSDYAKYLEPYLGPESAAKQQKDKAPKK